MQEKWSIAKYCSCEHCASCEHCSSRSQFSCISRLSFFVSSYFNPCNSFCFGFFFGNFIYTEHLYKPRFVQTELHLTFGNRRGRQFRGCFHIFPFSFIFFLPFLATKHSSEDDNLEDGWLDLFLLEEEGYWTLDLR